MKILNYIYLKTIEIQINKRIKYKIKLIINLYQ